ncbi:hypothetical protein J437_LFUL003079 [Ladona fulva]|uniref:Homeobox domain-containing protein n=1 Tax=Ladona fulva TaxID=123851 RepID=A0A8K0NU17_LADFU|nr:hypothetical protein J437_LFUL003079 [Ladona fulva]
MFPILQVKIWFQNRRMKWRNSKERELLAHGGSREQTLPNKNNPNPDLSDPMEPVVSSRNGPRDSGGILLRTPERTSSHQQIAQTGVQLEHRGGGRREERRKGDGGSEGRDSGIEVMCRGQNGGDMDMDVDGMGEEEGDDGGEEEEEDDDEEDEEINVT